MNLPNKLTAARLVLAPVFFLIYFIADIFSVNAVFYTVLLCVVYGTMELTDLLDGKIARKYHLVTDLGKVMDPFGDVIAHLTFFTCLTFSGFMPVWAFMVIVWREFGQSFMRMLLMGKGKAMSANIFGKSKTCLYAATCLFGFFLRICSVLCVSLPSALYTAMTVLCSLSAFASVMSFIIYIKDVVKSKVLSSMTR